MMDLLNKTMWSDDPLDQWSEEDTLASKWRGICFGGKGGGPSSTQSTVTQTSLPAYAQPFYMNMMQQAEAVANEPYYTYPGDRISQFTGDTLAAHEGVRDINQYGDPVGAAAQLGAAGATDMALQANYDPTTMQNTYDGGSYGPGTFTAEQAEAMMLNAPQFTEQARDYYMSPYMGAVTDRLKEQAILDSQRQDKIRHGEATQAGAYGGSRQAIGDYLSEEGMLDRLYDIDAEQTQRAFENAQAQFERDRNAYLQAGMSNQDASLRAALANQGALLQAQQMGEQSRQFGESANQFGSQLDYQTQLANEQNRLASAGLSVEAAKAATEGAGMMGQLGTQFQGDWLARLQALGGVGSEQQQMQQTALDTAYSDFINQRDYPRQNVSWLSGILHGTPISPQSDVLSYEPPPNPYSQLLGMGLSAGALSNLLGS